MSNAVYYWFGCGDETGHYLYSVKRSIDWKTETPWGGWKDLDGVLAPKGDSKDVLGIATLTHKDGWTALAFWDRSQDPRRGSNVVFLANCELDFKQAVVACSVRFPRWAARAKVMALRLHE